MTSTREKAIEAGARAAQPYAFNDEFWLARRSPDHHQRHAQDNARRAATAALDVMLPIISRAIGEDVRARIVDLAPPLSDAAKEGG